MLLDGVDPKDLREKEPLRDSLAKGFSDLKATLDGMMTAQGSRSILLDEDDQTAAA